MILIAVVARSPVRQTNHFVWANWENHSGNANGVAFFVSLVNANYIYGGIDGALHLAEEAKNAATAVPLALLSTISIGLVTALAFAIAMLYSISDFDAVVNTPTKYVPTTDSPSSSQSLTSRPDSRSTKSGAKQLAPNPWPCSSPSSCYSPPYSQ